MKGQGFTADIWRNLSSTLSPVRHEPSEQVEHRDMVVVVDK